MKLFITSPNTDYIASVYAVSASVNLRDAKLEQLKQERSSPDSLTYFSSLYMACTAPGAASQSPVQGFGCDKL